jgi:TolA-binding protein
VDIETSGVQEERSAAAKAQFQIMLLTYPGAPRAVKQKKNEAGTFFLRRQI